MPRPPAKHDVSVDLQRRNNQATAGAWDLFAPHRERMTSLVRDAATPGARLLVLGAGNGNDLALEDLLGTYAAIDLADLDEGALARAQQRVSPGARTRLTLHAPVDLTGALPRLGRWGGQKISSAALEGLPTSAADAVLAALPGSWDVVLSACLLSQILFGCGAALGTRHPQLHEVAGALVAAHLRSLARLVRAGGTALLATDVASSQTYPLEELWDRQPPRQLLGELVRTNNVFTGADPGFVGHVLAAHPAVAPLVTDVHTTEPWLWKLSDELSVMAYATRFAAVAR